MSNQIIISMLEMGTAELERTARAVAEDKLNWKPLDNGRTALDLLGDGAQAPDMCLKLLNGSLQYGPELFANLRAERAGWTRDVALANLEANTKALVAMVAAMPVEKLAEPMAMTEGGRSMPVGAWILMCYRSLMGRTAQINYIETLYGDFEMH